MNSTALGFTVEVKKWYYTTIWERSGNRKRVRNMNILSPSMLSADCTVSGE